MNQFLQFLRNNGQLVIILLALSLSGIGWIINKLREQAAIRKSQTERQRRIEEMLRTGRDPGGEPAAAIPASQAAPSHGEARERLAEMARRRQAQLEQMRREAQIQGAPPSARPGMQPPVPPPVPTAGSPPPIIIMGPSGPIAIPRQTGPGGRTMPPRPMGPGMPMPAPTQRPSAPARPTPRQVRPPQRPQAPKRRQPQPQPERRREPVAPVTRMPEPFSEVTVVPGGNGDQPRIGPVATSRGGRAAALRLPAVTPATAGEYRRMLATLELLSPPLALREGPGPTNPAF